MRSPTLISEFSLSSLSPLSSALCFSPKARARARVPCAREASPRLTRTLAALSLASPAHPRCLSCPYPRSQRPALVLVAAAVSLPPAQLPRPLALAALLLLLCCALLCGMPYPCVCCLTVVLITSFPRVHSHSFHKIFEQLFVKKCKIV